jgi:thiamine biosynthesis protein ThiS
MTVEIHVNGAPREVHATCTVAELVAALGLAAEHVAVELNRGLVPRAAHDATTLRAGDRVEVVTLVGGG